MLCALRPAGRTPSCARGPRFAWARRPTRRTRTNKMRPDGLPTTMACPGNSWARPCRACRTRAPTGGPRRVRWPAVRRDGCGPLGTNRATTSRSPRCDPTTTTTAILRGQTRICLGDAQRGRRRHRDTKTANGL